MAENSTEPRNQKRIEFEGRTYLVKIGLGAYGEIQTAKSKSIDLKALSALPKERKEKAFELLRELESHEEDNEEKKKEFERELNERLTIEFPELIDLEGAVSKDALAKVKVIHLALADPRMTIEQVEEMDPVVGEVLYKGILDLHNFLSRKAKASAKNS